MVMAFPGFSAPSASTEVPLEMLAACHYRIMHHCTLMEKLAAHLYKQGNDDQAQTAAKGVLRYFNTAAILHHQDEEKDVFPALLEAVAGSEAYCIQNLLQDLTRDHQRLETLWLSLRQRLDAISQGQDVLLDKEKVAEFRQTYEAHIKIEEEEVFPMASRLLGSAELDKIGEAMRLRRGITQV